MRMFVRLVVLVVGMALNAAAPARASFDRWDFNEVYSNADGSVQFIELFTDANFQEFTAGSRITSGNKTFTFPNRTPSPTRDHHLLLATPGFADLDGGVAPDFEIPVEFFDPSRDTLNYIGTDDPRVTFSNLPIDGVNSLHYAFRDFLNNGTPAVNSPTNYAGISGSIIPAAPMLLSDLTRNGFVDADDLFVLLGNWDTLGGPALGDIFDDPARPGINADDLFVLLADWTGPDPNPPAEAALADAAVPEPSTFLLGVMAVLGLFVRRWRRR